MKQINPFNDIRERPNDSLCVFCGELGQTDDHIPSKIFIDKPYPNNLHNVRACKDCNNRFSPDEQYLACLLECILAGSTEINKIERLKIKRTFSSRPRIQSMLEKAKKIINGNTFFEVDGKRIRTVLLKLGRGHIVFDNNIPIVSEPKSYWVGVFPNMTAEEKNQFESNEDHSRLLPEIGTRAFQRMVLEGTSWVEVQKGNYRYSTRQLDNGYSVKIVIREYLAAEIIWNNSDN